MRPTVPVLVLTALVLSLVGFPAMGLWFDIPSRVIGWVLLPVATIVLARHARLRAEGEGRSRWASAATSAGALAGLSLIFGGMAFLALPSMIAGRMSSNYQRTLADVRAVLSAEERFRAANGLYTTLEAVGPALDPDLASGAPRFGYRRAFVPAGAGARFAGYAYVAVPLVNAGEGSFSQPETGRASLCGDSTGRVCRTWGPLPRVVDGRCAIPESASSAPEDVPFCVTSEGAGLAAR